MTPEEAISVLRDHRATRSQRIHATRVLCGRATLVQESEASKLAILVQRAQESEASKWALAGIRLLEERTRRVEIDLAFLLALGYRDTDLDLKHVTSSGLYTASTDAIVVRAKGRFVSRHEIGIDEGDALGGGTPVVRLRSVWLGGGYEKGAAG